MRFQKLVWLAALLLPGAVWGAISAEGARVVQTVNAKLASVQRLPPGSAQGAAGRAHLNDVKRIASECDVQLRLLIRDRNEPEVQAARAKVDELKQYAESLQQGLQGAGQSNAQLTQKTYQFVQEMVAPGYARLKALVVLARQPEASASLGTAPAATEFALKHLEAVDTACRGKYTDVAGEPHPNPGMADQSPALWCKMGADRVALVQLSVKKAVMGELGGVGRTIQQMQQDLEKREGYLETEMTMIRRALWSPDELAAELAQRHAQLLTVAQLGGSGETMAEPIRALSKDLMKEAERLAPRWKFPASGPRDAFAEGLARQQVGKSYPGSAVRAALMQDAVFTIRKNALGIPLDRHKDGHVLYKAPKESLCRQQTFTYTETFDGTGYQKPAGVKLQRLRYLACP